MRDFSDLYLLIHLLWYSHKTKILWYSYVTIETSIVNHSYSSPVEINIYNLKGIFIYKYIFGIFIFWSHYMQSAL